MAPGAPNHSRATASNLPIRRCSRNANCTGSKNGYATTAPTPIVAPNGLMTETVTGQTVTGAAPRDRGKKERLIELLTPKEEKRRATRNAKKERRRRNPEHRCQSAIDVGMQRDFDSGIDMAVAGDAARVAGTRLPRPVDRGEGSRMRSDTPTRKD